MSKVQTGNEAFNLNALKNTEFYKKLSENSFIAGTIIPFLAKAGTVFQWIYLAILALVIIAVIGVIYDTIKENISEKAKKEINRQLANILNKYKPQIEQSYKDYLSLTKDIPNKITSLKSKYSFIHSVEEVENINPIDFAKGWSKGLINTIKNSKLKKQSFDINYEFTVTLCDVYFHGEYTEEQELAFYKELESLSTSNVKISYDGADEDSVYIIATISVNIKQEDINKIISLINQAKIRDRKSGMEELRGPDRGRKAIFDKVTKLAKDISKKYPSIKETYDDSEDLNLTAWLNHKDTQAIIHYCFCSEEQENNESYMNQLRNEIEAYVKELNNNLSRINNIPNRDWRIDWDGNSSSYWIIIAEKVSSSKKLYDEALKYHNELMNYNFNVANESLVTAMSRFIRNMLNVILKIMNNFKAMTIYGFRQLKRTELEAYTDSITLTTNRILNFSYASLYNLEVDIPLGMIKPYKVTTDKIRKCLESMNMVNRISGVTNSVNNLITSLMSGTSTVVKQSTINLGELKSLEQLYKEEHNCFSSTSRKDKELFYKVFESDHCFKDTYDLLKKTVVNEYDVSKVFTMLEGLYSKFDSILKMLENKQTTLTKSDLIQLSSQTTTLAKLFDMYGILIEDLQKVEHNFVLIMKTIHKTYEL